MSPGSRRTLVSISAWQLGQIMCVGCGPIGTTVVTIWVIAAFCGTYGLDGGTPPTACAYDGGADGGGTNPYGGGAPFLLICSVTMWL